MLSVTFFSVSTASYTWCIILEVRVTLRRWGNSLGIVIPKDVVVREGLKEGDELEVKIRRIPSLKSLFGKYRFKNLQEIKDELRKGWL